MSTHPPRPPEVILDHHRQKRLGVSEAILCDGKSVEQIESILAEAYRAKRPYLLTRFRADQYQTISRSWRKHLDYDPVSQTAFFAWQSPKLLEGRVCIVTAGTSDVPVAREAERTLQFHGLAPTMIFDVGVAGLWRLLDRQEHIAQHPIIIAIAGMDAALPTVLGGLVPGLIIAVPTSVGYGATRHGETALMALLSSCASGLVTVNIDNGYGAACAALRAGAMAPLE